MRKQPEVERGLIVRPARRTDAASIASLAADLARHVGDPDPGLTPERVVALGFGGRRAARYLVATLSGRVVGVAVLGRWVDLHMDRPTLYVSDVAVDNMARRRGVGRALMAAAAREALSSGALLRWEVWEGNVGALDFYGRLGATRLDEPVVVMTLEGEALCELASSWSRRDPAR